MAIFYNILDLARCPHPLPAQQNSPEEVHAATGRGAESGVYGGEKGSVTVGMRSQSAAEETAGCRCQNGGSARFRKAAIKIKNTRYLLQMLQTHVWELCKES